jgi:hypothetical protein
MPSGSPTFSNTNDPLDVRTLLRHSGRSQHFLNRSVGHSVEFAMGTMPNNRIGDRWKSEKIE